MATSKAIAWLLSESPIPLGLLINVHHILLENEIADSTASHDVPRVKTINKWQGTDGKKGEKESTK